MSLPQEDIASSCLLDSAPDHTAQAGKETRVATISRAEERRLAPSLTSLLGLDSWAPPPPSLEKSQHHSP